MVNFICKIYIEPIINRTDFSRRSNGLPTSGRAPVGFTVEEDITHGPLVFDRANNQWVVAEAAIKGYVHAPDAYEAPLLGGKKNEGLIQVNTLVDFQGDFITQLNMPVITIQGAAGKFSWQGIKGTINAGTSQGHVNSVKTDLKIGAISVQGVRGTFNTKEGTYQYDITRQPIGLWNGSLFLHLVAFSYINNLNANQSQTNRFYISSVLESIMTLTVRRCSLQLSNYCCLTIPLAQLALSVL